MNDSLIKEFKKLKSDIAPRQEWVNLSRDLLLSQINPSQEYKTQKVGLGGYLGFLKSVFQRQMLEPAMIMLLVLGTFLGSSLTINAAFYSLPGDSLYQVKLTLEKTHVAMITDGDRKVELKMEFVQKRIAEFDKIIAQSDISPAEKKKKINVAVTELKNNVVAINQEINKLTPVNKEVEGSSDVDPSKVSAGKVSIAFVVKNKTEELVKEIDAKVGGLTEDDVDSNIAADTVAAVAEVSLSAQKLIDNTQEDADQIEEPQDGIVEGASNEVTAPAEPADEGTSSTQPSLEEDDVENITNLSGTAEPVE